MNITVPTQEDYRKLNELHERFFSRDFIATDFQRGFLGAFVIKDNDGQILLGGGVRPLAETILVTNKDANLHSLGDALLESLQFSRYVCNRANIKLLHAFVKDETYMKHLISQGFQKRCQALFLEV